jgi:hypothetical protein
MGCTVNVDIDALTDLAPITGAGGQQLVRTMAVTKNPILALDAKRKSPVHFGRGWKSPIYLDIDTGRDLLISTPGSRTWRRSSMVTSRWPPLPTVRSRSLWTHSLLQSGPTQFSLQSRSALAGSESAAEPAIAMAIAKT